MDSETLRLVLVVGWSLGVVFFVWEFIVARTLPGRYAKASPNLFRVADLLFGVLTALTLYYLIADL